MAIIEQIRFIFRRVKIMSTENRIFSSQQVFGSNNQGVKLNNKKKAQICSRNPNRVYLGHLPHHLSFVIHLYGPLSNG